MHVPPILSRFLSISSASWTKGSSNEDISPWWWLLKGPDQFIWKGAFSVALQLKMGLQWNTALRWWAPFLFLLLHHIDGSESRVTPLHNPTKKTTNKNMNNLILLTNEHCLVPFSLFEPLHYFSTPCCHPSNGNAMHGIILFSILTNALTFKPHLSPANKWTLWRWWWWHRFIKVTPETSPSLERMKYMYKVIYYIANDLQKE